MQKAYKYRIYPDAGQTQLLEQTFGCCRKAWNTSLHKATQAHREWMDLNDTAVSHPSVTGYAHAYQLPSLKAEYPYMTEVSSVPLQQTLINLGKAFTTFFKKGVAGYPRWTCPTCGHIHDRDTNAAQNLYNLAIERMEYWLPGAVQLHPKYTVSAELA